MSSPGGSFLEGLLGGTQAGHGFRTANNERKRAHTIEDEELVMRRAQELRANVGFQLQQQVARGQINAQDRAMRMGDIETAHNQETWAGEADRRGRVKKAADAIRANPKFKADEHIAPLLDLPDEELVKGLMDFVTNPQRLERPGYGPPSPAESRADDRLQLGTLNTQVDDLRQAGAQLQRQAPKRGSDAFPLLGMGGTGTSPQEIDEERRFTADSAAVGAGLANLQRQADSTGVVRDWKAGQVQGSTAPRPDMGKWSRENAQRRAQELQRDGKSREEILRIMQAEGYRVQ